MVGDNLELGQGMCGAGSGLIPCQRRPAKYKGQIINRRRRKKGTNKMDYKDLLNKLIEKGRKRWMK